MNTATKEDQLQEIGKNAYASIVEMVAAVNCDYERLEELRGEKDVWELDEDEPDQESWESAFPDDAEELKELESKAGDCESEDDARERIDEDPLSVQVRSGWYSPGGDAEPEEFEILLCTGGPAVRIIGDLGQFSEPSSATLQAQDWFTPWTDYLDADQDALLEYCQCFYFGD